MSSNEYMKRELVAEGIPEQNPESPPSQKTLNELENVLQRGIDLLHFVYNNWDSYDTLTQQSLPQADYEKAIRLTTLARNTLEKFIDQLTDFESNEPKEKTEKELNDILKRSNLTMKSLINYYKKVGLMFEEPPLPKAA